MTKLKVLLLLSIAFLLGLFSRNLVTYVLAHGGNLNFIHACVRTTGGAIRIVWANDTCNSNETPLDWSQNGIGTFGGFTTNQLIGFSAGSEDTFDYRLFDNANFTDARFFAPSMQHASFNNVNFTNALFTGGGSGTLKSTNFNNSNFTNTTFGGGVVETNSDFTGTNFTNAHISAASFTDSNFTSANFNGATINTEYGPTTIQNVDFTNADFTNAVLTGVDFSNSTRTGVIWSNTTCPDGTNSDNNGNTCEGHLVPLVP